MGELKGSAMDAPTGPHVQPFFDAESSTFTYVLSDRKRGRCAIVDSVLDYDAKSGRTSTKRADEVIDFVRSSGSTVDWILETHVHADHLSAAPYVQSVLGGEIAIGEGVRSVHRAFARAFMLPEDPGPTLKRFARLLASDERFQVGDLTVRAVHVPGHTPADVAYVVEGEVPLAFVGDTLFMPDIGSARCDFPGGCASTLYRSVKRLLALPAQTRLLMCHDYPPPGRAARWETTVAEQRLHNIHVRDGIDEEAFVRMRRSRDATLAMPALMLPAVQVNIRAGELPAQAENGVRYLRIPLNVF